MINGSYFSENQKNVLGTVETRKNKYGRMEEFVSGNKEEAMKNLTEITQDFIIPKKDLGEVRDEDIDSDFFEFKKSDEVSFERFRANKARERMIKSQEKKTEIKKPEKEVEKKQKVPRKTEKPREVVSDV